MGYRTKYRTTNKYRTTKYHRTNKYRTETHVVESNKEIFIAFTWQGILQEWVGCNQNMN